MYPDYDFSALRAHHFRKEEGISRAEETIDSHLLEVSKVKCALHDGTPSAIRICTADAFVCL